MTAPEVTGKFYNLGMVLPENPDCFAELDAKDLRDALARVGVMADGSHRCVGLVFHHVRVSLETDSLETESSSEGVSCRFLKTGALFRCRNC